MKGEVLEGTQCDACGSYEFECREEQYFCVTCQLPVKNVGKTGERAGVEEPPKK
ncbi:MAG TPA: hypothetical protein VNX25_01920 [Verrucomicrobiae bacterium]|nr:hypothetical protein [Verrucomicrobiae bacterium]